MSLIEPHHASTTRDRLRTGDLELTPLLLALAASKAMQEDDLSFNVSENSTLLDMNGYDWIMGGEPLEQQLEGQEPAHNGIGHG